MRDANGRLSTRLELHTTKETCRKLCDLHNAELHFLGPNWAVFIAGMLHQFRDRNEAEFLYQAALDAELV